MEVPSQGDEEDQNKSQGGQKCPDNVKSLRQDLARSDEGPRNQSVKIQNTFIIFLHMYSNA